MVVKGERIARGIRGQTENGQQSRPCHEREEKRGDAERKRGGHRGPREQIPKWLGYVVIRSCWKGKPAPGLQRLGKSYRYSVRLVPAFLGI